MSEVGELHHRISAWCWRQGWTGLRPVQEAALQHLSPKPDQPLPDAVISAATAGGKTEAAFLPLLSRAAARREHEPDVPGFDILYIAPIKALINNQVPRLEDMGRDAELPVIPWHGDASRGGKARAMKRPAGVLLITPESLEAMLMKRARSIPHLFGRLDAIVIDELHAFLDDPRGRQLLSILHRIDLACGRTPARIGLSATLSEMDIVAEFLRPGRGGDVRVVSVKSDGRDLLMGMKAMVSGDPQKGEPSAEFLIAADAYEKLRGRRNLLFASSRRSVEILADLLSEFCRQGKVPDEFTAHHGNLSKFHREDTERRMRDDSFPLTIVCTSTLEMGIDIGSIATVGQEGPAASVAAIRQRLGRSGRRDGLPAVLRIWIPLQPLKPSSHPMDRLRLPLIRAIAMSELMLEGWVEPPRPGVVDLSTLLHQVMSLMVERNGIDARDAYQVLARPRNNGAGQAPIGVFSSVEPSMFAELLRSMGKRKLIEQAPDGALLLGSEGEVLAADRSFFAVFKTAVDWKVFHDGREIGTIPSDEQLMAPGLAIILAGKRWKVVHVSQENREVSVKPAKRGSPPKFTGEAGSIHRTITRRMREILAGSEVPAYLDPAAREILAEARQSYREICLHGAYGDIQVIPWNNGSLVFHWEGTVEANTLALRLARESSMEVAALPHVIEVDGASPIDVMHEIRRIAQGEGLFSAIDLARSASDLYRAKFDQYIDEELLVRAYAVNRIDENWRPLLPGDRRSPGLTLSPDVPASPDMSLMREDPAPAPPSASRQIMPESDGTTPDPD